MNYTPVKIGRGGNKVHAGRPSGDEIKRGRDVEVIYQSLCGSGKSSAFHSFRAQRCKPIDGEGVEVNCKKCLQVLSKGTESE